MAKKKKDLAPVESAEVKNVEKVLETPQNHVPKFKDDSNAFNIPIEDDRDYVSQLPSELLNHVLSYCVLDHEPELAVRQRDEGDDFVQRPHVLLSLAAMSKHFKAHVETFCLTEMTKHKDVYNFSSNAENEASKPVRRSARLQEKPMTDYRCYRMELVGHLQRRCIHCNTWCSPRELAVLANSVKCCTTCAVDKDFAITIVSILPGHSIGYR